jgi:transcriptional regulator GlxA family with amidase domain
MQPAMRVGILVFHHVNELEVTLPLSLLACAGRLLPPVGEESPAVEVSTVARSRFSVQTEGGLTLTPTWAFASAPDFDALFVPGGSGVDRALRDAALKSYFDVRAPAIARQVSVGAGALLLGGAGLLRNRSTAAPVAYHDRLEAYEIVDVVAEGLVRNDGIWCAARPIDAVDAAVALLTESFGGDAADEVAVAWGGPRRRD